MPVSLLNEWKFNLTQVASESDINNLFHFWFILRKTSETKFFTKCQNWVFMSEMIEKLIEIISNKCQKFLR